MGHFAAVLFFLHSLSSVCLAQLVVVRPGYVKAPFVRVYSYPDGGSYVRAPFVRVHSPGYRPMPFYSQSERNPTPEDLGDLDWKPLRRALRQAAANLDAQLSRFPTREVWRSHFRTDSIRNLVIPEKEGPPTVEEQAALAAILQTFDESSESSDLRAITNLSAFRLLHAALREYVTPVELRLQRQLVTSSDELHHSLDEISTGAGWQKYLALPVGTVEDSDTESNTFELSKVSISELEETLGRYDSVSRKHEYRMIAGLPQFRASHDRLRAYVDYVDEQADYVEGQAFGRNIEPIEELPRPLPE